MILAHVIALDPTAKQAEHFRRACGTARLAYNWALAEWNRMFKAGEKPSAPKLKIKWNAVRREAYPFTYDVTKCASNQAILNLGRAFDNFFRDLKKSKKERQFRYPQFKKKGKRDSFALWNDQFALEGTRIRIPNLGWVRMAESLRYAGKVMGAVVNRVADRWTVSVQVAVEQALARHPAAGTVVGVDLGVSTLMTLSQALPDGRMRIENPKARRSHMRRMRKLQRRVSRQELVRRRACAKRSRRQSIRQARLRRMHHRVACIRKDAAHKATTAIARAFGTVVIEDLNVAGMSKNHALAGAVLDAAFSEVRRQFEYKCARFGGSVVAADRFFPSSRRCSACGAVRAVLPLCVRKWACAGCGCVHDRDTNASHNLEWVGQAMPEPPAGRASPPDFAGLPATHGDIAALAAPQGATKLRWANRELNRRAHARTN